MAEPSPFISNGSSGALEDAGFLVVCSSPAFDLCLIDASFYYSAVGYFDITRAAGRVEFGFEPR